MKVSNNSYNPPQSFQASFLMQPDAIQVNLDYFEDSLGNPSNHDGAFDPKSKPKQSQHQPYEEMSTESTQNKNNTFSSMVAQQNLAIGSIPAFYLDTDGTQDSNRRQSSIKRNNNMQTQQKLLEEKAVQMMQRLELSHVEEEESKSNSNETSQNNSQQNSPPPQLNSQPPKTISQIKKVTAADFQFQGLLGEGSYGRVFLAKKEKEFYAVKVIQKRKVLQLSKQAEVFKERKALIMLDHPCIVRMHWSFDDKKYLYFVMDLAPNGELFNALKRETKFSYTQTQFLAAELILILEHMHSRGVAHRDLKPSNLILDEKFHIKLVDFGTAKFFEIEDALKEKSKYAQVRRSEANFSDAVLRTDASESVFLPTCGTDLTTTPRKRASLVGSEDYVAPEILAGQPSGPSADLWSLGVLIYLFLSGISPFKGSSELETFQNIQEVAYQFKDDEPNFTSPAKDLICKLLVIDPVHRLLQSCDSDNPRVGCYSQLRDHPFFDGVDFASLLSQKAPFDEKRFERSLLKEKIMIQENSAQPRLTMRSLVSDSEQQDFGQKRERHRSVLIPSRTVATGTLFCEDAIDPDEESKSPGSAPNRQQPQPALKSILKKRNRFGLYFKKSVVITKDHQFFYTDKNGHGRPKYIVLKQGHARIEHMSNNRFKLIITQPLSTLGRKSKAQKENSKIFKCANRQEFDLWTSRILESIGQNSQQKPEDPYVRSSLSFISPPARYTSTVDLLSLTEQSHSPSPTARQSSRKQGSFFGLQIFKQSEV